MSILDDLWNLIMGLFRSVFKTLTKILKTLWPLILVAAILFFAGPAIGAWMTSVGGPSWLATALTSFPGWVASAGSYVWGAMGSAWSAFAGLDLSTRLMAIGAAALLLAPDETTALVSNAAETVGEAAGDVIGGVVSGVGSSSVGSWLLVGLGAFLVYKVLTTERKRSDEGGYGESIYESEVSQ